MIINKENMNIMDTGSLTLALALTVGLTASWSLLSGLLGK